MLQLFKTLW